MLDPASIMVGLVVSSLGVAAWQIGRRRDSGRAKGLGALLVVLPWLITEPFLQFVVGIALFALVFWP